MTTSWSKTSIAGSLPTLRTTWIAESTSGRTASSSGKYHQVREPSRQPFIAATREPPEQSGATQDGPLIPSVLRKARAVTSRTIPEAKEARQMPGLFHVKGKPANAASTNRIPPGCGWIRNITSDRLLCKSLTEQCVLDNPTSLHHRQAGRPRGRIVLCPHETTASDGQKSKEHSNSRGTGWSPRRWKFSPRRDETMDQNRNEGRPEQSRPSSFSRKAVPERRRATHATGKSRSRKNDQQ